MSERDSRTSSHFRIVAVLAALLLLLGACATPLAEQVSDASAGDGILNPPQPLAVPNPGPPEGEMPEGFDPLRGIGVDGSGAAPTGGTPQPDFDSAVAADEELGSLPEKSELPDTVWLDFLFEFCSGSECFRDAHFMDPSNPDVGSGPFGANEPFHVREGFVNNGGEPLPKGFTVSLYVTSLDQPGEFGGTARSQTERFTPDYIVQGEAERCGPTYRAQSGPIQCQWFVHEFENGLPEGRHAIWAIWEAPCSAWLAWEFVDECGNPDQILGLFSSGFDSPYDSFGPSYTEGRESDFFGPGPMGFDDPGMFGGPIPIAIEPDGSGVAPTAGTPLPDIEGALAGDDGSAPPWLGAAGELPDSVQLDFLFEFCLDGCFRDAHFMDPDNPRMGSGPFTAGKPFHVRHGFINETGEPLGDEFSVVIYVFSFEDFAGGAEATRYTPDYVMLGESVSCGPAYRTLTEPVTCQWFVHEFTEGLPAGRHAMWAFWEAPCWAWADYGFVDSCDDPDEVMSLFSSGFDSPYGSGPPSYTEPRGG